MKFSFDQRFKLLVEDPSIIRDGRHATMSASDFSKWLEKSYPELYVHYELMGKSFFRFCEKIDVDQTIHQAGKYQSSEGFVHSVKLYIEDNEILHALWML